MRYWLKGKSVLQSGDQQDMTAKGYEEVSQAIYEKACRGEFPEKGGESGAGLKPDSSKEGDKGGETEKVDDNDTTDTEKPKADASKNQSMGSVMNAVLGNKK